jgi:hypothetical protein
MCTFFFSCHTYTLASETKLEQPSWLKNRGQFSQKKVWLRVGISWGFVGMNGEVSVTLSNAYHLKYFIDDRLIRPKADSQKNYLK